jgi:hypothetical protein
VDIGRASDTAIIEMPNLPIDISTDGFGKKERPTFITKPSDIR